MKMLLKMSININVDKNIEEMSISMNIIHRKFIKHENSNSYLN